MKNACCASLLEFGEQREGKHWLWEKGCFTEEGHMGVDAGCGNVSLE